MLVMIKLFKEDGMRKTFLVVSCLSISAAVLWAATEQRLDVKTGVWQVEYKVKYTGLPPQIQAMVDQMNPQQRAQMGLGAPKTYKTCITAKNLNTPWTEGDKNCRWTVLKSTASDLELHGGSCKAGKSEGDDSEIDMKIHAVDSEHVRATMHGTLSGNGMNATLDGNYTGKWLGAACPADMK